VNQADENDLYNLIYLTFNKASTKYLIPWRAGINSRKSGMQQAQRTFPPCEQYLADRGHWR